MRRLREWWDWLRGWWRRSRPVQAVYIEECEVCGQVTDDPHVLKDSGVTSDPEAGLGGWEITATFCEAHCPGCDREEHHEYA